MGRLAAALRHATIGGAAENRVREGIAAVLSGAQSRSVWSPPRLRRTPLFGSLDAEETAAAAAPPPADDAVNAEFVLTRAELQPVLHALRSALGFGTVPLDSPNRLQEALTTLIRSLGGSGTVAVRRSPAALLTPEYWQIAVAGLDRATHDSLDALLTANRR